MKKYRHFGYEERCQLHALERVSVRQIIKNLLTYALFSMLCLLAR